MNINTLVGTDSQNKEVHINFSQHHFILLVGATGTGKSIFHNHLYTQLIKQNTQQEIGFIFLDMARVDFYGWKSPYIITNEAEQEKSVEILESLVQVKGGDGRHIFIHIEECDMFAQFTERAENAVKSILKNRQDITIIYSTSRPGGNALRQSLLDLVDVKIVFEMATEKDLQYVLGVDTEDMPGSWGKIIVHDSKKVSLRAFSDAEVRLLSDFQLS